MSELPPDNEESADVDALYRRLSAADPSQPGEGVRLAVLAYATRRAAQAASDAEVIRPEYSWQRRRPWARPATYGALAAGILAAFMFGPRIMRQPQVPATAALADRAGGPAPVYADLNSSQLDAASPPLAMNAPEAKGRRVPRDALQRQPAAPPAELASSPPLAAATSAAPAPAAAARAEAAGHVSAESARADAATASALEGGADVRHAAPARLPEDPVPALWRAAESGDLAALRDLHQQHANLNATDGAGRTALMIATLHGHSQAVSALLDYGADPNIADARGESPLDAALAADESEIISALKRHGAH
jgi:hypothetical protein